MRQQLTSLMLLGAACFTAQNNLNLQLEDGSSFKVLLNDKAFNASAQAQVLVTGLRQDTVHLKVEMEKGERYGLTFYLVDKGKHTDRKEFSYVLKKEKNRLRPVFMGMYPIEGGGTTDKR